MRLLVIPTHSLTHQVLLSLPLFLLIDYYSSNIWTTLKAGYVKTSWAITFKFCYFLVIAPTGWWLFHGYTWYPRELGGSSVFQPEELWKNWPCVDKVEWADVYYLVQLAYHMHSFLSHLCSTRRKDFWEMLIHHIAAVTLITTSYCFNFVRIGILVFLVHDCSDVFTYGATIHSLFTKILKRGKACSDAEIVKVHHRILLFSFDGCVDLDSPLCVAIHCTMEFNYRTN